MKLLPGLVINQWTTVEYAGHSKWLCRCECGVSKTVGTNNLTSGKSKSCGHDRGFNKSYKTDTGTYNTWSKMMRRCYDPLDQAYAYYGGRGITVCDKWHKFFDFQMDVGIKPSKLTINRIDNNGMYEPGNVEWATSSVQAQNRRSTKLNIDNVIEIINQLWKGERREVIAQRFCVSTTTINYICNGKAWVNVSRPWNKTELPKLPRRVPRLYKKTAENRNKKELFGCGHRYTDDNKYIRSRRGRLSDEISCLTCRRRHDDIINAKRKLLRKQSKTKN